MKRYLSIWFPDWSLTRLHRSMSKGRLYGQTPLGGDGHEPEQPSVLVEVSSGGLRIAAANSVAKAAGITTGLSFTDAKARCPNLLSQDIDRTADAKALNALAHWMTRISPIVAVDGHDGIMVETTGCAHLYGGEQGLLREVSSCLKRDQIRHQIGIAGTPGAASALARTVPNTILDSGCEHDGLADLPVTALRISDDAETLLRRFGINRIKQLYSIDRKSLARRFRSSQLVDAVHMRLDQALGITPEHLHPIRTPVRHFARLRCPEPIGTTEAVQFGLTRLTDELCSELARLGLGGRRFTLRAYCCDGSVSEVSVTTARAVRSARHILRLFGDKLATIDPSFGIDHLILEAHRVIPMETGSVTFSSAFVSEEYDKVALSDLADRIVAKLGEGAVQIADCHQSHLPEEAERLERFSGELPGQIPVSIQQGARPLRMFSHPERIDVLAGLPDSPPQRFIWRRVARRVMRADGPERIGPEWWKHVSPPETAKAPEGARQKWLAPKLDPRADAKLIEKIKSDLQDCLRTEYPSNLPRTRDYYRVEDTSGRRYWLFRDGLYGDGRGGHPNWYVHGMFA